jgi:hypothetical protein
MSGLFFHVSVLIIGHQFFFSFLEFAASLHFSGSLFLGENGDIGPCHSAGASAGDGKGTPFAVGLGATCLKPSPALGNSTNRGIPSLATTGEADLAV